MNITIVGAGNVGIQFAAHAAEKGHIVTVFGSKPEKISNHLSVVDENDVQIHSGDIKIATSNSKLAFETADVIFITMPAYCMDEVAEKIVPYVNKNLKIGIIPGIGGGECAFKTCLEKGATVFGLQRVPSVARLVKYGEIVKATGYREELFVAALPQEKTSICAELVSGIFDMPCSALPNYLNLTLTPSNQILHTTRLKNLFGNYSEGVVYERIPLFYEEWNNETSELLLECDDEVQILCKALSQFDLSYVKSLRIHYESPTPEAMTKKISSIKGFKGLTSPVLKVEMGYIPDLQSRYFKADFAYGLSILVQIAGFLGINVPHMQETLQWYYDMSGQKQGFNFSNYGISNLQQLLDFYSR